MSMCEGYLKGHFTSFTCQGQYTSHTSITWNKRRHIAGLFEVTACVCGLQRLTLRDNECDGVFTWSHQSVICLSWLLYSCVSLRLHSRVEVLHEQHTDEFPPCADQITQPTFPYSLLPSLPLSFSQSWPTVNPLQENNQCFHRAEVLMPWFVNIRCTYICFNIHSASSALLSSFLWDLCEAATGTTCSHHLDKLTQTLR